MNREDPFAEREKTIPIVMSFDPGFLLPSSVTMISVMENGNKKTRYHFYIMTKPEHRDMDAGLFDRIADIYPNFSYQYVRFEDDLFSETRLPVHVVSRLAFARMMIAHSIPLLDKCIYLDGDVLVRWDIAMLQKMGEESDDFEQNYLMAAPDLSLQNRQGLFFESFRQRLGWDDLEGYFNSGVMVMNLRKQREDHMLGCFLAHADKEYYFGDQDILNVCCRGKTGVLPVCWNMFPGNIGDEEMLQKGCTERDKMDILIGNAAILHFAGEDKPWKCIETVWEYEWYRYACLLPETPLTEAFLKELRSIEHFDGSDDKSELVRNAKRYVLYGYTDVSRKLLDRLEARMLGTPWCFCDTDPEKIGMIYRGIPCVPWKEIRSMVDKDTVLILCGQSAWKEIRQELLQSGIPTSQMIRYRKRDFALVSC